MLHRRLADGGLLATGQIQPRSRPRIAAIEPNSYSVTPALGVDPDTVSAARWMSVILRVRWRVLLCGILGGLLSAILVVMADRVYTSIAVVMPEDQKPASMLGGLASQFNLALPSSAAGESPAFYADLLKSREVLGAAVDGDYQYVNGGRVRSGTLIDIYHPGYSDKALNREAVIDSLAAASSANVITQTGVIHVSVTSHSPELAQQITRRLIELLDQFNRERRKSHAASERQFTETRLKEIGAELRHSEDNLQGFLQQNRNWSNSPELSFQHDRLNNDLELRRGLYADIAKAYETARLDEVRDTPLITTIEGPSLPVRPDSRHAGRKIAYGFFIGVALAILIVLLRNLSKPVTSDADSLVEFQRVRREALDDVLHPLRSVKEKLRRPRAHV